MLVLDGLKLEEIPAGLSQLCDLRELELCNVMLTNLPDELVTLRKLTKLRIVGKIVFWYRIVGKIFFLV